MRYNHKKIIASILSFCILGSVIADPIIIKANSQSAAYGLTRNQTALQLSADSMTPTTPDLTSTPAPSVDPNPSSIIGNREMTNTAVVIDQLFYYFKKAIPVIKDNQVYIPIEEVAIMLGATMSWNQEKTILTIKNLKTKTLILTKDSMSYVYNSQKYQLTTNTFMLSNSNYLMVDFNILNQLGFHYSLYNKAQIQEMNYAFEDLFVITTDQQEAVLRTDFNFPRIECEFDCYTPSLSVYSKKALTLKQINSKLKKYGTMINDGIPLSQYKKAMQNTWRDVTQYNKTPSRVTVDLTKQMDYVAYEKSLLKLSRYDGVYVYVIGKSTEGRNIYSITIDMGSNPNKKVLMFTGQTHAREFAGGVFIVKQFADLIQKAQTNPETLALLQKVKYVAVPIINVDAREAIINQVKKYVKTPIGLWKAYINGTDGNRNYPGISSNQLSKGVRKNRKIKSVPGAYCYNGDYSGSNKETQAMMKWIYYYVVQEKASYLADYHMQGRLVYGGKTWDLSKNYLRNKKTATRLMSFLNKGNLFRYTYMKELSTYGIDGDGSTLTDFAASCALGAKYSTAYEILVMTDSKTRKEYTLMQYKDLDKYKGTFVQANSKFTTTTFEIGYGSSALGYSIQARKRMALEYKKYHYDKLLEALPQILLN